MNAVEQLKLIVGSPLQLGSKALICPALNIKGMRALKEDLDLLQKGIPADRAGDLNATDEFMAVLAKVAHVALSRNYPGITMDEVEEGIDFNNVRAITLAVLGASSFKTASQFEAEVAVFGTQEADKGAQAGESTGTV